MKRQQFQEKNLLLKAISPTVRERLGQNLKLCELKLGQVLYESGDYINEVLFPTNCIVSLLYVMEDGRSAEISMVGNEGIVGLAVFMGGYNTHNCAVVQSEGYAYRLADKFLKTEFDLHGELHNILLRYTQALITQISQTAVCNRHHLIDQQLCRFLLLSMDRLNNDKLFMTQELIASMLGVRREGVTESAGKLQAAGIIKYQRGHITVLDRIELEQRCCECYKVVKKESDKLLEPGTGDTLMNHRESANCE